MGKQHLAYSSLISSLSLRELHPAEPRTPRELPTSGDCRYASVFDAPPVTGGLLFRNDGAELCAFPRCQEPKAGRLASRAALICSGVRRSGSVGAARSFARATWRLCRFASRLSILILP